MIDTLITVFLTTSTMGLLGAVYLYIKSSREMKLAKETARLARVLIETGEATHLTAGDVAAELKRIR